MATPPTGGNTPRALPPIKFRELADALLSRIDQLLDAWLPGGKVEAGEYVVHSVWRSEKSPSLKVALGGAKAGQWMDFGGDHKGGDLVSLYAAINGLDMGQAALQVAREEGLEDVAGVQPARPDAAAPAKPPRPVPVAAEPKAPARDTEHWTPLQPVPEHAPAATFWHFGRATADITHTATYRCDGGLLGYVVRFQKSDGNKETLPYVFGQSDRDGSCKWVWRGWDEPRPLYLPDGLTPTAWAADKGSAPTVIVVEGEKKADILQALLNAGAPGIYLVASWPGGSKAWRKAQWSWVAGSAVMLWPDCDGKRALLTKAERDSVNDDELARAVLQQAKPLLPAAEQVGMKAMLGIGSHLRKDHACTVQLLPIPEPGTVLDGWDCADAITTDGWDFARVMAFFASAYALPPDSGDDSAQAPTDKPADSKKRDGPGEPEDGGYAADDDNESDEKIAGKSIPRWLGYYYDGEKKKWLVSRKLVIAALEKDPALRDVLGFNELSNGIDCRTVWPFGTAKPGPVSGSADLLLGDYLTRTYGLPSIGRAALVEAIETVAHSRRFHPVREYLQGLKWDGVSRIDKWLVYAIGETPESIPPALYEYLCLVGRYILLGMCNRIMEPGCKFDYCPVLEGPGGLGKSTFVEALASSAFFGDTHFDVARGKDGQEQVQGLWIYEIAELANFGKAEIGLIKAFISAKIDRYRPAYGRTVEAYARQCLLFGTTNESTYLRDRTGNRRFWPIPVRNRIKIGWLIKHRDQLLAEAFELYKQGVDYTPSPEDEARLFVPMQESRLVETAVQSEMTHILTRSPGTGEAAIVNELIEFVTISQLVKALGMDAAKSNAGLEAQIRSWMDHEKWERAKRQINGVRAHGYVRPKNWPPIEPPESGSEGKTSTDSEGDDDAPF